MVSLTCKHWDGPSGIENNDGILRLCICSEHSVVSRQQHHRAHALTKEASQLHGTTAPNQHAALAQTCSTHPVQSFIVLLCLLGMSCFLVSGRICEAGALKRATTASASSLLLGTSCGTVMHSLRAFCGPHRCLGRAKAHEPRAQQMGSYTSGTGEGATGYSVVPTGVQAGPGVQVATFAMGW